MDPEIVYRSNRGIVFEKTVYKNGRCKLVVRDEETAKVSMTYRYKNVVGLTCPYLNWDNLNCCNGWRHDETYLYTAVQQGKKLYSSIVFTMFDEDWAQEDKVHHLPVESEIVEVVDSLRSSLPNGCIMGEECPDSQGYRSRSRHIFICKEGAMVDYINLAEVFAAYERFGVKIGDKTKETIQRICAKPLMSYSAPDFDYVITQPSHPLEVIITGLLFGYPIETTVSLIEEYSTSLAM